MKRLLVVFLQSLRAVRVAFAVRRRQEPPTERRLPNLRAAGNREQQRTVVSQGVMIVSVTLMNVVVARHWGAAARGELASGTVLATIAASVGGLGMHDVVVWAARREAPALLGSWLRASLLTTVGAGVVAAILARYVVRLDWNLAVSVGLMCPLIQVLRVQCAVLLAYGRLRAFDLARTASLGVSCLAMLMFAAIDSGVHPLWVYLSGQFVAILLISASATTVTLRGVPRWPRGSALRLGVVSSIGGLVQTSLSRIDVVFVALILTQSAAGVYALALAGAESVLLTATALSYHALRAGSRSEGDSGLLAKAVSWTAVLVCVGYAGLHFFAAPILGRQFGAIDTAFLLLSPGTVAIAAVRIRWASSMGGGKAARTAVAMMIGVLIQSLLDLLLVRHGGINGAAAASSIGYGVAAIFVFWPAGGGQRNTVVNSGVQAGGVEAQAAERSEPPR